jgi:hypothetical protein
MPEQDSRSRHRLFRALLERDPTPEELTRFDRISAAAGFDNDDTWRWYFVFINEFYDDRLKNRIAELERVADVVANSAIQKANSGIRSAVQKALEDMSDVMSKRLEGISARRDKWTLWRSWGLFMGLTAALCAVVLNAGYVMGSGKYPFWFNPSNSFELFCSWFFSVPSGWILFVGSLPYLAFSFRSSLPEFAQEVSRLANPENRTIESIGKLCFSGAKILGTSAAIAFLIFVFLF